VLGSESCSDVAGAGQEIGRFAILKDEQNGAVQLLRRSIVFGFSIRGKYRISRLCVDLSRHKNFETIVVVGTALLRPKNTSHSTPRPSICVSGISRRRLHLIFPHTVTTDATTNLTHFSTSGNAPTL